MSNTFSMGENPPAPTLVTVLVVSTVEVAMNIINIQQEKHKLVQGRQGIEGTGRLSSRCPSIVKSTLLLFQHVVLHRLYVGKSC